MSKVIRQDSKQRILGNKSYVGDQEIIGKFDIRNSTNKLIFSFDPDTNELVMRDTDENEIFTFNSSTGNILIQGGNITIKDQNNATVIDSNGVVGNTMIASNMTYLTGANIDVTGDHIWSEMGFDYTFTLDRATPFFFFGAVGFSRTGRSDCVTARIKVGTDVYYPNSFGWEWQRDTRDAVYTEDIFNFAYLVVVPAGTDVPVDLEVAGQTGDETITVTKGGTPQSFMGYIKLGT